MLFGKSSDAVVDVTAKVLKCGCCCANHCKFNFHNKKGVFVGMPVKKFDDLVPVRMEFQNVYESTIDDDEEAIVYKPSMRTSAMEPNDAIYNALTSLETNFFMD